MRTHGQVGLLYANKLMATLGDCVASTPDGVALSTLCCLVLSTLGGVVFGSFWWGVLQRMAVTFLMAELCFCLSAVKVGRIFLEFRKDVGSGGDDLVS